MHSITLYQDRISSGIPIKFSGHKPLELEKLKKLDNYMFELTNEGTANLQQKEIRVYDCTVLELHQMVYSYVLQNPNDSQMLQLWIEKLYEVTIDNQELHKLILTKSTQIPDKFTLDFIHKTMRFKIKNYRKDHLNNDNQKKIRKCEYNRDQTSKRTPRKMIKKYIENPKEFKHIFPILDPELHQMFIIFILKCGYRPTDIDFFSCNASIINKIVKTVKQNMALRIKLDRSVFS